MMLLAILLQVTPPAPQSVAEGQAAPFAGVLLHADDYAAIRGDRNACIVERDAARRGVEKLSSRIEGLPALLALSREAFEARLFDRLGDFTRKATVELAKAPLPPKPEPSPWWHGWVIGGGSALAAGLLTWAAIEWRYDLVRD